jgi:CubicO group peptidase (beta-lactamase class C family)
VTEIDRLVSAWPGSSAAGWSGPGTAGCTGPADQIFPWASVTKVVTAVAVWVAVEEETVAWDDPAGPAGSTLAHLLSHASGLAPDGDEIMAPPGQRRIYSNRGVEVASEHVGRRSGVPFTDYVRDGVLAPLGLDGVVWAGSPASGASGSVTDLLAIGREMLEPTLVAGSTVARATSVAFPGLSGILPGFGFQAQNDWGLGVEIRDGKHPHWTGRANSTRTFGHFGQSGSFLWVDPDRDLVAAAASETPFGSWATRAWPAFADAVIRQL